MLKPGASLYVGVPNLAALEPRLFGPHYAWEIPRHLYFFTPETLGALLEKAGFRVKRLQFDLYNNAVDASLSLKIAAKENGWPGARFLEGKGMRLAQRAYAPAGVALAACGLGTRFLVAAERL